ncbi:MAG: hypothetical protein R2755_33185 [Acidimicrobiales bacterium]
MLRALRRARCGPARAALPQTGGYVLAGGAALVALRLVELGGAVDAAAVRSAFANIERMADADLSLPRRTTGR